MGIKSMDVNRVGGKLLAYAEQVWPYLAVMIAVLIVVDLVFGVRTLFGFADSLFIGGGIAVTLGGASAIGRRVPTPVEEGEEQVFSFAALSIGTGIILAILSIVIHQFI